MTRLEMPLRLDARRCLRLIQVLLVDGGFMLGRDFGRLVLGSSFCVHGGDGVQMDLVGGNEDRGPWSDGRQRPLYDGLRSPGRRISTGNLASTTARYLVNATRL